MNSFNIQLSSWKVYDEGGTVILLNCQLLAKPYYLASWDWSPSLRGVHTGNDLQWKIKKDQKSFILRPLAVLQSLTEFIFMQMSINTFGNF